METCICYYLLAKKFISFLLYDGSSSAHLSLTSSETISLRLYCDSHHINVHLKKNLPKLVNFCAAILILTMEEKTHFQCTMLYYFKKGKKTTETPKMVCAVYAEGAVTDRMCQKWFVKFLVLLSLWPNNPLPWGCLTHWKMFTRTPGLSPREVPYILKIPFHAQ